MNGALSLARLFRGPVLRIGKCQSLTGGGGGREAGWKMSPFTGKSCEPRNVSSGSNPPFPFSSLLPPYHFLYVPSGGLHVCVYGVVEEVRGGAEVTQHIFSTVKTGGRRLWEGADTRLRRVTWSGKSPSAEETRGSISRWGIRRRLIIQTGRAGMNFSQRLTPLVIAKHCIKSNSRSNCFKQRFSYFYRLG